MEEVRMVVKITVGGRRKRARTEKRFLDTIKNMRAASAYIGDVEDQEIWRSRTRAFYPKIAERKVKEMLKKKKEEEEDKMKKEKKKKKTLFRASKKLIQFNTTTKLFLYQTLSFSIL